MLSISVLESPGEGFAADISNALRPLGVTVGNGAVGDVVVLSPNYRGPAALNCRTLLAPDGGDAAVTGAENVVTYGMSRRAALTLSSHGETTAMLAVRREIAAANGKIIEEQELPVAAKTSADATLAAAGASIMLGLFPNTGS